ncbi:DUF5336 domain-containing protein [Prescottella agglutinans]|uniref:DUF5336 domain-containing protein n=1 Tax=Prescottella agglutinans TaxID=1644129 RepID=UPI003D95AF32
MTYTDGGSYGQPSQASTETGTKNLSFYLGLAVAALGIVNFLLGFAPYVENSTTVGFGFSFTQDAFESGGALPLAFLLTGGLLAGLSLLPKQEHAAPAAVASLVGFLVSFVFMLSLPGGGSLAGGGIAILVLSFVQAVIAIAVFLFGAGIVKMPQPRPSRTHVHPAAYGHPQGYNPQAPQQGYGAPQGYSAPGAPQGYPQQMPGYGQSTPQGYPQQPTAGYGQFQAYQAQQPTQHMPQQSPSPSAQPQASQPGAASGTPGADASGAPTQAFDAQAREDDDEKK